MGKEIERKFLVKGEFRHMAKKSAEVLQTYLSIDNDKSIRVRISGDKAFITIKARAETNSITRGEWEYEIPLLEAQELMRLSLPGRIVKTRYFIPAGAHTWEVDIFHDKNDGLIIAEIELSSESEDFEKPDWIGEEVTGRPEYYNANLIR